MSGAKKAVRTGPRRWLRVLLWVVGAAVALRLLLWVALPLALDGVAGDFGLRCDVQDLSLSLHSGRLELHDLRLLPVDDAEPLDESLAADGRVGALDFALVDVDMHALLSGRLHIERIDLDGLALRVRIPSARPDGADGDRSDGRDDDDGDDDDDDDDGPDDRDDAPQPPSPESIAALAQVPVDLTLPFSVAALRVQRARCLLRDDSVSPPLSTELSLDVRLSDLGSTDRPAQLLIRAEARDVLDELHIQGTLAGDSRRQAGGVAFRLRGARPAALAGVLAGASLAPVAEELDLRFSLSGSVQTAGEHGELCGVEGSLNDLQLDVDGRSAFTLQSLKLAVPTVADAARGVGRTDLGELLLTGLHAAIERLPSGTLRVAGFDVLPPAALDGAPTTATAAAAPTTVTAPTTATAPTAGTAGAVTGSPARPASGDGRQASTPWTLGRLALRDVQLDVHDGAVSPAAELRLLLAELKLGPLQSDAGPGAPPAILSASLAAPGLFDALSLHGALAPFGEGASVDVTCRLTGLRPVAAEPYLRAAGLRSTWHDGSLEFRAQAQSATNAQGAFRASARLSELQLRDGERTLLAVPAVAIDDVVASADGSSLQIGDVDIAGPALELQRDATGSLHLLGLATLGPDELAMSDAVPASAEAAAPPVQPVAGARLLLRHLRWHGVALHVRDEAVAPPIDLALHDVGIELSDLAFGGDPSSGDSHAGTLKLWLGVEGIVQRLEVQGTVQSRPGPLDLVADFALQATGVQGGQAAAWMEAAGLQSAWSDGQLTLALHAALARRDDALHADLQLTELALDNAGRRWLALQRLSVEALRLDADGVRVGSVQLSGLQARAERDAQGGVLFAGVRLPPVATIRETAGAAQLGAAEASGPPPRLVLERVELDDVTLRVVDAFVSPPADVSAQLAARLLGFDTAASAQDAPARFDVSLVVPGALDSLVLQGDVLLTRDSQRLQAALLATGLRSGGLSGHVPAGLRCELHDGRLALKLDALHAPAPEGGDRFEVVLRDLEFRDGAGSEALFELSRLACIARRVDVAGGVVQLDEVSLSGVKLDAHRGADGDVRAFGLVFGEPPGADVVSAASDGSVLEESPGMSSSPGAPAVTGARAAWPDVRLDKLEIDLERVAWRDDGQPGQPPVVAHLRLFNPSPLALLGPDPDALPPWELGVAAGASPVIDTLDLALRIAPFEHQPSLALDVAGRGLQGAGLTAMAPSLAASIDGSELVAGTLDAHVDVQLAWPRRGPTDFDLSHGFGLRLEVDGLELRAQPQGELLAGLDGLDVHIERISPASGDIHVKSAQLRTPHALLVNRADGLRVLGLRLIPTPARDDAAIVADVGAGDVSAASRMPELRIDSASITGIDLQFRDETLTPPLLLPINALDAELTGFSTSAQARRPMRFGVFLGGGEVPLPKPVRSSSVLAGFASAAVASLSGADERRMETEPRRVVQEIALTGRLTNGPSPQGWAQLNVTALELMSFASAARSAGVIIGDGVLDTSVKLAFLGAEGMSIESSTTLTDLSLSEPANGPVSQYLKLPAPLDSVVFLLRNQEGRILLDLNLSSPPGGASSGALAQEAISTLGALTTRAVAASPLRVAGTFTDALGVTGGGQEVTAEVPLLLGFGVGDAVLMPEQRAQLAPLVARLAADPNLTVVLEHVLGEGDVSHEAMLANPPAEVTAEVVERLRQARGELQRQRDELAAQVGSYFAVGREEEAAEVAVRLRDVDHDLGVLEQGLDHVLDLLRPGAARRADQRTRLAGLALGNQRLAGVARALREAGLADAESVIEVRPARWQVQPGDSGGDVILTPRLRPQPEGLFSRLFGWMWPF